MRDPQVALEVHAAEELGVRPGQTGSPWQAALSSFISFAVGALIPLLPWFFITPIFFTPDSSLSFIKAHPFVGALLSWANPLAPFIEALRSVLYSGKVPSAAQLLYSFLAAGLALAAGVAVFRRMEGDLAVVV